MLSRKKFTEVHSRGEVGGGEGGFGYLDERPYTFRRRPIHRNPFYLNRNTHISWHPDLTSLKENLGVILDCQCD